MTKKHSTLRRFIRRGLNPVLLTAFALPGAALAGPLGGEVIRGEATIAKPDDFNTVINQASERAVVNWQSFSVGGNEFVVFNQPSASSVILNRVIGNDASEIFGSINANGRVFLVNPNGIFFGEGATLDVNGLVASTLDIDSDDFMDGNYRFHRAEGAGDGEVRNAGVINADDGGFVVLAGDYVENTGVIAARLGHVVMASGAEMTLDMDGTGLIGFAVNDATLSELAGVRNAGEILADGSMVIMTAKVARDLLSTVVNNEGLIAANSVEERSGVIYLRGEGGHVEHSGQLVADGLGAGERGGAIRLIASDTLFVHEPSSISAQGADKGGFVEVSGHGRLVLAGDITIGNGGMLLIDPETLTIVPGGAGAGGTTTDSTVGVEHIESQLNAGTHVRLVAESEITADPAVTQIIGIGPGSLSLNIGVVGGVTGDCADFGFCAGADFGDVTISPSFAPGTIDLSGVTINIPGMFTADGDPVAGGEILLGDIAAAAGIRISSMSAGGDATVVTGKLISNTGDIEVVALSEGAGTISVGDVSAHQGHLTLDADGSGPILGPSISTGTLFATGMDINAWADIEIASLGAHNPAAPTIVKVNTPGMLTINGAVSVTGSSRTEVHLDGGLGVQLASVSVTGNPTNPVELDGDDIQMTDTYLHIGSSNGGIDIAGNLAVITGDVETGLAFAGLFAAEAVNIGGSTFTRNGVHPLFVPPARRVLDFGDGPFLRDHGLEIHAARIHVAGNVDDNLSVRMMATDTTGEALRVDGDLLGRRFLMQAPAAAATFGDIRTTRSFAAIAAGDVTTGNIELDGPHIDDSPDIPDHAAVQLNLESSGGTVRAGDITASGWRVANVLLFAPHVETGSITASVLPYEWDSDIGGPSWFASGAFNVPWHETGTATTGNTVVRIAGDSMNNPGQSVLIDGDIDLAGIGQAITMIRTGDLTITGTVSQEATGATIDAGGDLEDGMFGALIDTPFENESTVGLSLFDAEASGAIDMGDIGLTGPATRLRMVSGDVSIGDIALTSTGESMTITILDGNGATLGTEHREAGHADILLGDGSGSVGTGDITVRGSGRLTLEVAADAVTLGALDLIAEAGQAQSTEYMNLLMNEHATGSMIYGEVLVRLGTGAGDVGIAGAIALSGFGDVELDIFGDDIAVGGAITVNAGAAEVDRTKTSTDFDPDGNEYTQVRTDTGTRARAWVDIEGDGVVSLGSVSASGGEAEIMLGGHGSLQTGALSATGSGVTLTEEAVWTGLNGDDSFTISNTMNGGPATVDVYGGAVSTGTITVNGTGGGWVSIEADDGYSTGDVTLTIGDGSFTTLDTRISDDPISVSGGIAALMVMGDGAVAGDVQISASGAVYLGGTPSASGTIGISAGDKVSTTLPADLAQMLADSDIDHPFEDDLEPVELPPLSMQAGAVGMSAGTLIDLGGGVITADGPLHLASGGDIRLSGATLTAGTLILQADGNIQNQAAATLSGGAVLLEASGDIALGESSLSISGGSLAALTGDPDALQVLIDAGLLDEAITPDAMLRAGGSLALDSLAFDGGYLVLMANGFSLGSFDGPEGDYLLQATPTSAATDIVLTGTVAGAVTIDWDEFLSLFDGATYILGASDFDGTITTGRTTELDIGDANMLFASSGPVPGLSDVATTGLILNLEGIVVAPPPPPPPPTEPDPPEDPPEEPPESRDTSTPTESEIVGSEPSSSQVRTTTRPAQRDSDDDRDDEDVDVDGVEDDPDTDDSITHDSDDDLVCE